MGGGEGEAFASLGGKDWKQTLSLCPEPGMRCQETRSRGAGKVPGSLGVTRSPGGLACGIRSRVPKGRARFLGNPATWGHIPRRGRTLPCKDRFSPPTGARARVWGRSVMVPVRVARAAGTDRCTPAPLLPSAPFSSPPSPPPSLVTTPGAGARRGSQHRRHRWGEGGGPGPRALWCRLRTLPAARQRGARAQPGRAGRRRRALEGAGGAAHRPGSPGAGRGAGRGETGGAGGPPRGYSLSSTRSASSWSTRRRPLASMRRFSRMRSSRL